MREKNRERERENREEREERENRRERRERRERILHFSDRLPTLLHPITVLFHVAARNRSGFSFDSRANWTGRCYW